MIVVRRSSVLGWCLRGVVRAAGLTSKLGHVRYERDKIDWYRCTTGGLAAIYITS